MGLSRQTRIITLLVIDTCFFFLELIVGYAVGSLALVADSFHMLNDVLSLVVALYTIKLATSPSSSANSYGWQRAEILGALINGVFLIALCATIGLEAIGRIISPPEISEPKLIVIVGSLGLLSNIVGLALFHEHGHSHGPPPKPKKSTGPIALEEDADEGLDPVPVPRARADSTSLYQHPAETRAQIIEAARIGASFEDNNFMAGMSPPVSGRTAARRKHASMSRSRNHQAPQPGTNETIPPRGSISRPVSDVPRDAVSNGAASTDDTAVASAESPTTHVDASAAERGEVGKAHDHGHDHDDHSHGAGGGGGHSHGSMNMHGVFLHVLGDALGNVGVISAGLVIWFCHGRWTLYFDPGVSLLITCIIFSSAMPLVKSASAILMQGVPNHVSLEDVREAINLVDGVVSVHDLHVWQLSEVTTVASVHVLIKPGSDYMRVAADIRHVLHEEGIHSVTIQPEFSDTTPDSDDDGEDRMCLIRCPPGEQCEPGTCCPPPAPSTPKLDHVAEGDESSNHSHHSH